MKRTARKLVVLAVGLAMGWWAAGLMGESAHVAAGAGAEAPAYETEGGQAHEHSPDAAAARGLVPTEADRRFFGPVLAGIVILFAAAIVLGIPALKIRGPLPPDPAEMHDATPHAQQEAGQHGH